MVGFSPERFQIDYKYIIVLILVVPTIFLSINLAPILAKLPLLSWLDFFPGWAVGFAFYPSLVLSAFTLFIVAKLILKDWKYPITGVLALFLAVVGIFVYNQIELNLTAAKTIVEIQTKIKVAHSTTIKVISFEAVPEYDANGIMTKVTFKVTFDSNVSADMNVAPRVYVLTGVGGNRAISVDIDGGNYGDLYENNHGQNTVLFGKNTINFQISNFTQNLTNLNKPDDNSVRFAVRVGFGIHVSDPFGYGQGNATFVENVEDSTGRAIAGSSIPDIPEDGKFYLTDFYKVKN